MPLYQEIITDENFVQIQNPYWLTTYFNFINTDMTEVLPDKVKEGAAAQIPMGMFGDTRDVADAVAFLASDQARYITGQVLCVDGGMAM